MTANEFTNVKDIRKNFLYTRDGYIMAYLRIHFLNISLLPEEEKQGRTRNLAASFEGDRKDFAYCSFPREIDLDSYKDYLKRLFSDEVGNIGKRHLLTELLLEANELATNGENYEHQHYIKLWHYLGTDRQKVESELLRRAEEFKSRYEAAGIPAEILQETEIIKMCNLFGNAVQAPFDQTEGNLLYESIAQLNSKG